MTLLEEAIRRFTETLERARREYVPEYTAMTLATVHADGQPAARTVLLKGVDTRGFVFYTNRRSRKGQDLAHIPRAALCFYWAPLALQVLVEGEVFDVSDAEADAYFASRPRLSQIGAWASQQSEPLATPDDLTRQAAVYEARFEGREVPRPPHWSGYRVVPRLMEFWSSREGRLHIRERYELPADGQARKYFVNP
ncbi:MAG: pyridoxamine 5'-phosphate oxidase [Aquisalimonadaceae bacterium]